MKVNEMANDCERLARLFEFADDDAHVTRALVAEARAHVETCEPCARAYGADVAMAERLAIVPPLAPPARRSRRRVPVVILGAAVIAATIALVVVARHRPVDLVPPTSHALRFELPPETRFTCTSGVVRFDRTGPSAVYETHVYPAVSRKDQRSMITTFNGERP
ncbi:MAG: hypothetical protein HYR85_13935 [Planctomycetes bacterium]|nr:hypothetical protein [Planctomycetota bacterium]MBI3843585.1 hypothetical protein [Planctomycetota bacterium]